MDMPRRIKFFTLLLVGFITPALFKTGLLSGQTPKKPTSGQIHEAIKKLNFLGSVMYIAAHPDDENTRLISYMANEVKATTTYLSITRGDGGQNLIGPEIWEGLGVIRTQELLAARRVDGGNQYFTRANDFGYSKHPDETLNIWNKDEVLSDVVWAIRLWQPDVVINRFDHRSPGTTHGHHTSSAMLSMEAFDLAGNPSAYSEQLKSVQPWKPNRLFFNTSWFFYGSREAFDKADKSNLWSVDGGVYFPMLGISNGEIAAESRSMHKSQGFGSSGSRGSEMEYLEFLKGQKPSDPQNLFEGINTTWSRIKGGQDIGKVLTEVEAAFDHRNPWKSIEKLIAAKKMMDSLEPGFWKEKKLAEIDEVISACLGLFVEASVSEASATPGQTVVVNFEAINRSPVEVLLQSAALIPGGKDTTLSIPLQDNVTWNKKFPYTLPAHLNYTSPYWLNETGSIGMYSVKDQQKRGKPELEPEASVLFTIKVMGETMICRRSIVFKRTDRVKGEQYAPFEVTPPVFVNFAEKVLIFGDDEPKTIEIVLKAGKNDVKGSLSLAKPQGWAIEPASVEFSLTRKSEEKRIQFKVLPPREQSEGMLLALAKVDERIYSKEGLTIQYDHIPTQTIMRESTAKIARIDLKLAGQKIGYIMGAGDDIPTSLRQIGYHVTILEPQSISAQSLAEFDAVVIGIRAFNTEDRLKFVNSELLKYAENGGVIVVQYNTSNGLVLPSNEMGPFPFQLSRERVTLEEAPVKALIPDHPVLRFPNVITEKDFEGWVQERGLYFPSKWDPAYQAVLSCNDPGEPPMDGGLLVGKTGKGYYVYTGYAWFRQLPAGVSGAFRIFANMLSLGKETKP